MMMALSSREGTLLAALLGVGILVGGYMGIIRKEWTQWRELSSAGSDMNTIVKQLEIKEQELNQTLAKYQVLSEQTQKKIAYTFEDKDLEVRMKSFMDKLTRLSKLTGNELITIHPYSPEEQKIMATQRKRQEALATTGAAEEPKPEDLVPADLKRFKAFKEDGLPLYSTEMEMKIRGTFPNIQRFVRGLTSLKSDLVKVQTMYLSYEGLENPSIPMGQSSGVNAFVHRNTAFPVMMSTRLKFYLLEPGRMNLSELARQEGQQKARQNIEKASEEVAPKEKPQRKNRIVYAKRPATTPAKK
jgi:hypothetical protein